MSRLLRKFNFCSKTDTTDSAQRERSEVECAVCQDQPTKPCTVPCGNHHVFCQPCLQGVVTHNNYTTHFPCPLCRKRVRIPLGGVAAFRQDKGSRSRFLARLPVIRPRCRRRRSSTDSVSSGWPDNLSLSVFDIVADGERSVDEESDGLSSMGVPSEGAGSISDLNIDPYMTVHPRVVLERIRQRRERISALPELPVLQALEEAMWFQRRRGMLRESSNNGEGQAREEQSSDSSEYIMPTGGDSGDTPAVRVTETASTPARDDVGDIAAALIPDILSDSDDLDMTVVLQLIADMEKNDQQASQHSTASEEEIQADTLSVASDDACSQTETVNEATAKMKGESPGSSGEQDVPEDDEDWKLRTIRETAIPRPKLSFPCSGPSGEKNRSFRSQEEEESPQPNSVVEEGTELPRQGNTSPHSAAKNDHKVDQKRKPTRNPLRLERDIQTQSVSGVLKRSPLPDDTEVKKSHHLSAEASRQNSPLKPEHSKNWNIKPFSPNESHTRNSPSAENPSHSERLPNEILSPERWRNQELQNLRQATSKPERELPPDYLEENPTFYDTDPHSDVEDDVISEGATDRVRRIRSLQHRWRRPESGAKRPLTRSHSARGERRTDGGERGGERRGERY